MCAGNWGSAWLQKNPCCTFLCEALSSLELHARNAEGCNEQVCRCSGLRCMEEAAIKRAGTCYLGPMMWSSTAHTHTIHTHEPGFSQVSFFETCKGQCWRQAVELLKLRLEPLNAKTCKTKTWKTSKSAGMPAGMVDDKVVDGMVNLDMAPSACLSPQLRQLLCTFAIAWWLSASTKGSPVLSTFDNSRLCECAWSIMRTWHVNRLLRLHIYIYIYIHIIHILYIYIILYIHILYIYMIYVWYMYIIRFEIF